MKLGHTNRQGMSGIPVYALFHFITGSQPVVSMDLHKLNPMFPNCGYWNTCRRGTFHQIYRM